MTIHDDPTIADSSTCSSFSTVSLCERGIATELIDHRGLSFMPLVFSYNCAFLDIKNDAHSFIKRFKYGTSIHIDTDTLPDGVYDYILFLKDCVIKEKADKKSKIQKGKFRVSAGIFGDQSDRWQ